MEKNKQGTKIYWECIQRKPKSCTARIHTKSKDHNYEIVKRINEHVHQSTKSKVDAKVAIQELKEEVVKSNHPTRSLIANCLSSLDDCGRAELRNVQHLSRNVRNWKQQTLCTPPIPSERTGFVIPPEFQNLDSGEKFLQYDSGSNDENRILLFITDDGIRDLRKYKNWAVDGTFKVSPDVFYQLFTIHVQIENSSFPRAFALLPNKRETTYEHLFKVIKNLIQQDPHTIMSDFEKATINVLTTVFPQSDHNGCFFHFSQALYRKIVDLGFKTQYHNESSFNLKVRCFSALAFLPCDDVVTA